MTKYMYFFRTNPDAYRAMSPQQMQQIPQKWMEWRSSLEKGGNLVQLGDRLDAVGKVVRGREKAVSDGPFVEVKDSIQGYVFIQAETMEQAIELAKGCPILDGGGTVEIRPFYADVR